MSAAEFRSKPVWCFSVFAAPQPGVMPRVLELFAKRGLVPTRVHADVVGEGADGLVIDLHVPDVDGDTAEHVAACLRGLFDVERVLVATKRTARTMTAAGA